MRGLVQGVGFRPAVWRWAYELGLTGEVANDGGGLVIRAAGAPEAIAGLQRRLTNEAPRLARVDAVETAPWRPVSVPRDFRIVASEAGATHTHIAADVAICQACRTEILDPAARRHGYALTNCTECGPRLSIITAMPYDRARTTMAAFEMCIDCRAEYERPADRRFHAEPIACPACGPKVRLVAMGRANATATGRAAIDAAAQLLRAGACIAIKGIGGYQLACDATNAAAVACLRAAKRRATKPFALMARDLHVIRRYAATTPDEDAALASREAPIVLLDAPLQVDGEPPDAMHAALPGVAPGLHQLGFMLPATPLHVLLLEDCEVPLVMTSGNISDEPQIIDDANACEKLAGIASHVLTHDRPISLRLDDSVVQHAAGKIRVLRRARGYAPAPIPLPPGFETAPDVLACGADLKATVCIVRDGTAILSPHQGDLQDATTLDDYRRTIDRFSRLLDAKPQLVACDLHPDYGCTRLAEETAGTLALPLMRVQHHHAHIASCLAENGRPLDAPRVLGIALDGTGFGEDGTIWGGEMLVADYWTSRRVGRLKPVALPGGEAAVREPWRSLYAHLVDALGWPRVAARHAEVPAIAQLAARPLATLDRMIETGLNAPLASSCGRLFDAVAAACGLAPDRIGYEGEAAQLLEALVSARLHEIDDHRPYSFEVIYQPSSDLVEIDPTPMWVALLDDLTRDVQPALVGARFHDGLATALCEAACSIVTREAAADRPIDTIALSGGVLQNRLLDEALGAGLAMRGFEVLRHAKVPAGDGGLSLGQAAIAVARALQRKE